MLSVDRVIAASLSDVWDLLVDVNAWPSWGPTIRQARLDAPQTRLARHATGTVQTSVLVAVPFVITEFEPESHWAWRVAGVAATRHRVDPYGQGTRVAIAVPWWATAYLPVCALALRRMDEILTGHDL